MRNPCPAAAKGNQRGHPAGSLAANLTVRSQSRIGRPQAPAGLVPLNSASGTVPAPGTVNHDYAGAGASCAARAWMRGKPNTDSE